MQANSYSQTALFYDADLDERSSLDLPFYLGLAKELPNPSILELACGTGRVTLALLTAGYRVTGIDHSLSMLQILRRRLALYTATERRRLHLEHTSIANFALDQRFHLAIAPFRSLQMLTPSELVTCLQAVAKHLLPTATFAFDMINIDEVDPAELEVSDLFCWEAEDETDGTLVRKWMTSTLLKEGELLQVEQQLTYEVRSPQGKSQQLKDTLRFYCYTPQELEAILRSVGLQVQNIYGGFQGEALGHSVDMIYRVSTTS